MPDSDGACRVATFTAEQCSVAVPQIEDRIGQRIKGWKTFDDGLIIQFQDNTKMALWSRRIDCIDPPYAPLSNAEQSVQPDNGGVTPTAVDAEPASIDPVSSETLPARSQLEEAWMADLRKRFAGIDCGPDIIRDTTRSLDGNFEYLLVCGGVTTDLIVQRRIRDGRLKGVIDGKTLSVIRNGPWRGFLAVMRHKYRLEGGSYEPVSIVRPDGKEMFEVPGTGRGDNGNAFPAWLKANGWEAN
jgi:hypothetical protein